MANQVKLTDVVKPYVGTGDFLEWLSKFELACDLRNFNDGRHKLLPMFLEGAAFAVYKQLTEAQKDDYAEVRKSLVGSFSDNCFDAYRSLLTRRLQVGESVDVFLADLKRLLSLCEGDAVPPGILRCAFVNGLPSDVRLQVVAQPGAAGYSAEKLLPIVKAIVSAVSRPEEELCAATRVGRFRRPQRPVKCYKCGIEGHVASRCASQAVREGTSCYRCGSAAHYVRDCPVPAPSAGNGLVGVSSAPVSPTQ